MLATEHGRPNGDAVAGFPLVTFAEPVSGPIAIGYSAHYGLGTAGAGRPEPTE